MLNTNEMKERNAVLVKMMEANPVVIDNHTDKEEVITGLAEFNNPEKGLACCFAARYYSLNACLKSKDGRLHCSQMSIGGVFWGEPSVEGIDKYNESCIFDSGKIKCIYLPNGDVLYPTRKAE